MGIVRHMDFEVADWGEFVAGPMSMPGYRSLVMSLGPQAYWRMGHASGLTVDDETGHHDGIINGSLTPGQPGALAWDSDTAVLFNNGYVAVSDPGPTGGLNFAAGDAMTMVAWIAVPTLGSGERYVAGKGRLVSGSTDQNWSVRLLNMSGQLAVSVLYRGAASGWHRWDTTQYAPIIDGQFHMLTVSCIFGQPLSMKISLDGVARTGQWMMGDGADGPVSTASDVWIGSSQSNNINNRFEGVLDELSVHRQVLPAATIKALYHAGVGR